jgi:hypothetical protein
LALLFRDGQAELPSEAQLATLAGRLQPAFAAPVGSTAKVSPLTKGLLGALGVVGVGLLAFALRGGREAPPDAAKIAENAAPTANTAVSSGSKISALPPGSAEAPAEASASAEAAPTPANSAASENRPSAAAHKPALSEAALLERARAALASDPARALALTRQHQARFPSGVLKQEREVIAIEALRRLGQSKAASERAGSFEQAFPDSAHRRAVEGGLSK